MIQIVGLLIPFFGLIALGAIFARTFRISLEGLGWLNIFVVWLALPALFYDLLSKTPIETLTRWDFIAANVGVTFVIFVFVLLLGLATTGGNLAAATVQGLAGGYGNIGFMGPGLALLAFGREAAIPIALIFCFENIMHFTLAPALMALGGRGEGGALKTAWLVVKRIATHPFIIATAIGVAAAAARFEAPAPLARLITQLANAAAPCALFSMGVTLALRPLKRMPWSLGYIAPMKLLVHPIAMLLALTAFGPFDPVWVASATLLAGLPTATNVFVIAQQYGIWTERASASVLVTTALSVLTVSILLYAMGQGLIPGAPHQG